MRLHVRLLLFLTAALFLLGASTVSAHPTGTTTMFARLAYADAAGARVDVTVAFVGGPTSGQAVVTYKYPDGSMLQDDMSGCTLTNANEAFKLDCTNPHYTTWDDRHFRVYSERASAGELLTFDLVGPVQVSLRFEPASTL